MPKPEIEEFAKILVGAVRDPAIRSNDLSLRPDVTHAIARRWRESARAGRLEPIAKTVIPDVVDDTLFYLLRAIDEGVLKLSFTDSKGQMVDLAEEGLGELAGWYSGVGGWCAKYSKERYTDDYPDRK